MQTAEAAPTSIPLSLLTAPMGKKLRLLVLQAKPAQCQRLREMGFCESAQIERISGRTTLLCQLCGIRIALSGRAANHIVVEMIRGGG